MRSIKLKLFKLIFFSKFNLKLSNVKLYDIVEDVCAIVMVTTSVLIGINGGDSGESTMGITPICE